MTDLLRFPLFEGMDPHVEVLKELAALGRERDFAMREVIIDERLNDTNLYFLLSGQVSINKADEGGRVVPIGKADASQNPFFGEGSILGKGRKIANVVAQSQCRCYVISAADFGSFADRHPAAAAIIFRNVARRLYDHLSKTSRDVFIAGLRA